MIADRVLGPADEKERKRFLKRALRFTVKDKAEGERVVSDLCKQFSGIKTFVVDDTCVAFQHAEGERALTVFYLIGWFAGQGRVFVCE